MSHTEGVIALCHPSLPSAMPLFADQAGWKGTTQLREASKVPFLLGHGIKPGLTSS